MQATYTYDIHPLVLDHTHYPSSNYDTCTSIIIILCRNHKTDIYLNTKTLSQCTLHVLLLAPAMLGAFDAIRGHKSAHSLATRPVTVEPVATRLTLLRIH